MRPRIGSASSQIPSTSVASSPSDCSRYALNSPALRRGSITRKPPLNRLVERAIRYVSTAVNTHAQVNRRSTQADPTRRRERLLSVDSPLIPLFSKSATTASVPGGEFQHNLAIRLPHESTEVSMAAAGNSTLQPVRPIGPGFPLGAALLLFAICLALWLAGWGTQGFASAWPRFEDDAYYYLEIARNVASGHGFTADTLSPTNGFQPLWLWCLVAVAWLTSGDTTLLLTATQSLVVVIFCLSGGLLCALLRARVGFLPPLIGMAVLPFPRLPND